MHGPAVVSWLLVALCGATGAYCLARVRGGVPGQRRGPGIEAAMGLGMAAMALPGTAAAPLPLLFAVLFGATAAYALGGLARGTPAHGQGSAHCLHHVLEALAMAYMAVAMHAAAGGGAHLGHPAAPGGIPAVTGALLVYFALYALRTGTRLAPAAASGPEPGLGTPPGQGTGPGTAADAGGAPATAQACRLALALGSFAMLLTL